MNQADGKYKELVEDIIDNGYSDKGEQVRTVYDSDGAPAHTKKVFAKQIQFDNSEFPILTTKFVGYKTAIKELILFWIKQTVKEEDFHEENVQIWNQWFKDGNLGRSYGYQFESHRNKDRKEILVDSKALNEYDNKLEVFRIENMQVEVKSVKNLSEKEINFLTGWYYNMIKLTQQNNSPYSMDKRWLDIETFIRDMRYVPQWFLAKDNLDDYVLSLNYFNATHFCLDTVVWLHKKEDEEYELSGTKHYVIKHVDGSQKVFPANDLYSISEYYNSPLKDTIEFLKNNKYPNNILSVELCNGKLLRKELSRNQVVELIQNIKNNPQSRRLLTNFFNHSDVPYKSLQECAYGTNWDVMGNKLNLILIQRSLDVGLGCSFNWVQYNILQRMVAQVTGLELGTFTHQIGNAHIYDRHEEALLKQVNQLPYTSPTLLINKEITDFFDFTVDDFELVCYTNKGKIKLEVAV